MGAAAAVTAWGSPNVRPLRWPQLSTLAGALSGQTLVGGLCGGGGPQGTGHLCAGRRGEGGPGGRGLSSAVRPPPLGGQVGRTQHGRRSEWHVEPPQVSVWPTSRGPSLGGEGAGCREPGGALRKDTGAAETRLQRDREQLSTGHRMPCWRPASGPRDTHSHQDSGTRGTGPGPACGRPGQQRGHGGSAGQTSVRGQSARQTRPVPGSSHHLTGRKAGNNGRGPRVSAPLPGTAPASRGQLPPRHHAARAPSVLARGAGRAGRGGAAP